MAALGLRGPVRKIFRLVSSARRVSRERSVIKPFRHLSLCMVKNVHAFVALCLNNQFFQELIQSVERFWYRSGPTVSVGPDLGPNCLQRLSAGDRSYHLQEKC